MSILWGLLAREVRLRPVRVERPEDLFHRSGWQPVRAFPQRAFARNLEHPQVLAPAKPPVKRRHRQRFAQRAITLADQMPQHRATQRLAAAPDMALLPIASGGNLRNFRLCGAGCKES